MMAERDGKQYTGGAKKTFLTVPVNASAETLTVADASSFPDPVPIATPALGDPVPASSLPFVVTIARGTASEEKVLIQSRVGNTLTVVAGERGYDGTGASSQSEQASVEHTIDAFSMSKFMEHTNDPALTDAHFIPQINGLSAKITVLDTHVDVATANAHVQANITGLPARLTTIEDDATALDGRVTTAEGKITTAEGDITAIEGQVTAGLGLRQVVTFTSSGTFTKADYAWLRAVRVRCQGAGGGAGGAAAGTASVIGVGRGGRPGVYAESVLLASALLASETVTVGVGGAGAAGGAGSGLAGTASSFGLHVEGEGGGPSSPPFTITGSIVQGQAVVPAGFASFGQIIIPGSPGHGGVIISTANNQALAEGGGSSVLGSGGDAQRNDNNPGANGKGHGAGGGACASRLSGAALKGGDGSSGIVILELYA